MKLVRIVWYSSTTAVAIWVDYLGKLFTKGRD
jgi:hypothetical protein